MTSTNGKEDFLDELVSNTQNAAVALYQNDVGGAQPILDVILPQIQQIYLHIAQQITYYREKNIEIPLDILLAQFSNLKEAFECQDIMALADTLMYEIREGLLFYKEIRGQVEDE